MEIITGRTGVPHVTSEDDRMVYASLFGSGEFVLPVLNQFAVSVNAGTLILTLAAGYLIANGAIGCIRRGDTDDVALAEASSGYNRIDTIVARYTNTDGIEKMEFVRVAGSETLGTPVAPTLTNTASILAGALIHDMPLYDVSMTGSVVNSVTPRFTVWGVS